MRAKECVSVPICQPTASKRQRTRLTRRGFLKLPMSERRRILAQQAEALVSHYQTDTEWKETEVQDFFEP